MYVCNMNLIHWTKKHWTKKRGNNGTKNKRTSVSLAYKYTEYTVTSVTQISLILYASFSPPYKKKVAIIAMPIPHS